MKNSNSGKNKSPKSLIEFPASATISSHSLTGTFMNMVGCQGVMTRNVGSLNSVPKVLEHADTDGSVGELTASTYEMRIDLEASKQKAETAKRDAASKVNDAKGLFGLSSKARPLEHASEQEKYSMMDAAAAADAKKSFLSWTARHKRSFRAERCTRAEF